MHLAAIGSVYQKAHVYEFVVEALGRLLVDEANVCLDLDFDPIVGFDCLNSIRTCTSKKYRRHTVDG